MNFNLDDPYLEYESDDIPYNLYEIHGVGKIKELSQQLRSFFNYKTAIMRYRFCPKNSTYSDGEDKIYKKTKTKFKTLASKFLKLLYKIRKNSDSYEVELRNLIERLILTEDKTNKNLITDLKDSTQELFTLIHVLSEQKIYLHPKLLKFIVKLVQEACVVFQILNYQALEFYEELKKNYVQLHDELTLLLPEEKSEKIIIKKKQLLEEGLKEW